jgi:hypothetical protein
LYNFTDLAIWSTVEIGLAMIASSLATLKPLFRKFNMLDATQGNTSAAAGATTSKGSTLHSRKRSIMSLGRAPTRDFGEIVEDERELVVLEIGSKAHLKRISEEDGNLKMGSRDGLRWDDGSQGLGGKVRVNTKSTLYGEW